MKLYSLNMIHTQDKDGKNLIVPARTVFETSRERYDELLRLGAAQKATAEQVAVYDAEQKRKAGQAVPSTEASDAATDGVEDGGDSTADTVSSRKATTSTPNPASSGTGSTTGRGTKKTDSSDDAI